MQSISNFPEFSQFSPGRQQDAAPAMNVFRALFFLAILLLHECVLSVFTYICVFFVLNFSYWKETQKLSQSYLSHFFPFGGIPPTALWTSAWSHLNSFCHRLFSRFPPQFFKKKKKIIQNWSPVIFHFEFQCLFVFNQCFKK